MSNLPVLFVILPLGFGFLYILLARRRPFVSEMGSFAVTLTLFMLSLILIGAGYFDGQQVIHSFNLNMGGWALPMGINIYLDSLTVLMLIIVNMISFTVILYSVNYMKKYSSRSYFYALILFMLAGMNGILLTGDLFNLYVFLELASVSSYILVSFGVEAEELEAAFKYLVMGAIASALILLGVIIIYLVSGTLNIAYAAQFIQEYGMNRALYFAFSLLLMGFSLKAALIPFHAWLPDAHPSAPAPISAMLSGVVIKVLGVYALLRVGFNLFDLGNDPYFLNLLLVVGGISLIIGVLLALYQWDIKRLFAYHSISQMGYVVMAIGLGTGLGMVAGLFHLFNHAVFKSLLFLNSGALETATGTRSLKKMGGLARKMPVTAVTSMIGSLSISGIPPFNGFWSKLMIIFAAVLAGQPFYALLAVIGSVLTLASFMKVQRYAFWDKCRLDKKIYESDLTAPIFMRVSMLILAVFCIFLSFLILPGIYRLILSPASLDLLQGAAGYIGGVGL